MICTTLSLSLSTVYRDCHLLPSALSVQEEEHEAHRHCDAAGGPARYERSCRTEGRCCRLSWRLLLVLGYRIDLYSVIIFEENRVENNRRK